ncbi:hypothetical protein [Actinoplanes couchii]|uniref:Uncharacterized protein n=1 Tax=Actinoplanes couchii TaxID=403638 RepID=A0ABQ3XSJ6_9ACTN|nr:hypothetical protein [Actinoplanes couchii]MDR6320085.1 hypothetical protein [Actinoplanes couchii]GID61443.1 hypothetical protein Aco03nite_098470 [Actinoplanes couchii]
MEPAITSGGTPGPRLADEWAGLDNNVYGSFTGSPPAKTIAASFAAAGWRVRASSWTDFEVEREWVCLELRQLPDTVIFSGVVDPSRLDDLGTALAAAGLRYSVEFWDGELSRAPDRTIRGG